MLRQVITWYFKKKGWRFAGPMPKTLRQCLIVAGPHKSKLDFLLGIAVTTLTGYRTAIMVDEREFFFPQNILLKRLNAKPYNPRDKANWIKTAEFHYESRARYSMVLTSNYRNDPAGSFNESWYDLASRLKLPVVLVGLDYSRKTVQFHSDFIPGNNRERDIAYAKDFFQRIEEKMKH